MSILLVLLACAVVGWGIFWVLVRPFTRPLEDRIPQGRSYRPSVAPKRPERAQRVSLRRSTR